MKFFCNQEIIELLSRASILNIHRETDNEEKSEFFNQILKEYEISVTEQ